MNAQDMREFRQYLQQCTNQQVYNVYHKEKDAGRLDYAELAKAEAEHRAIGLGKI